MLVGGEGVFAAGEGANEHEEGGLREVEVGEESGDDAEFVTGRDENMGFAGVGGELDGVGWVF